MDAAVDLAVAFHWPPGAIWDLDFDEFLEWWARAREILEAIAEANAGKS